MRDETVTKVAKWARTMLRLQIGLDLRAERDGESLGFAPVRLAEILIVLLAARGEHWSSRRDLAAELYPGREGSAATASFRKLLSRTRAWLGPDAFEESGSRIRLSPESTVESVVEQSRWLLGNSHPALQRLRGAEGPTAKSMTSAEAFEALVRELAEHDVVGARQILVGARGIVGKMNATRAFDLTQCCQPGRFDEEWLPELIVLEHAISCEVGLIRASAKKWGKALPRVVREGHAEVVDAVVAQQLFAYAEIGEVDHASQIALRHAGRKSVSRCDLLKRNALGCLAWNRGHFREALDIMQEASRTAAQYSRADQAHFWQNYSILASEVSDDDLARRCIDRAEEALPTQSNLWQNLGRSVSGARELARSKRADVAIEGLNAMLQAAKVNGKLLTQTYLLETLAEVHTIDGDGGEARRCWHEASERRREMGCKPTPRLLRVQSTMDRLLP